MDPLTHTLVGASLAATRLGKTTHRAVAALVIGANLPDIDVLSYFAGSDTALGFRRGWTHGLLALAVLPALLALALWAWETTHPRATNPASPLSPGWLFALCYLAALTHPLLDWLNTYGMRWFMPFDSTWYYGDSVFIMDPWIWLVLGAGWLLGRPPRRGLLISWAMATTLLLLLVGRRAPAYVPVVIIVLLVLLSALAWRPASDRLAGQAASVGLALAAVFIGSMIIAHRITETAVRQELRRAGVGEIDQLMVGPLPANPFAWEFIARTDGRLRHGRLSWLDGRSTRLSAFDRADALSSSLWPEIIASGQIPGFLGWVRFPWLAASAAETDGRVQVLDARYTRQPTRGFGGAEVLLSGRLAVQ